MAYFAYEIRMTKDTPTGTRHLVRCNRLGKWAITSWVGSTGSAMGTVEAQNIAEFVKLFGGCHGGPDRKHQTLKTRIQFPDYDHPVLRGLNDLDIYDEFYYRLKFINPLATIIPLAQAKIDGKLETISWAWERSNGGRSLGFSGLHFHKNWNLTAYRRLMIQGILWTLKLSIPVNGVNVDISEEYLKLH